jgi:hypothetical protein
MAETKPVQIRPNKAFDCTTADGNTPRNRHKQKAGSVGVATVARQPTGKSGASQEEQ